MCGTPDLWDRPVEPQSYGDPKPVETQGCGTPGLWDPRSMGTTSLWNFRTVGPQSCGNPKPVGPQDYGNPKTVGPLGCETLWESQVCGTPGPPLISVAGNGLAPRGRCESFISVLLLCIKVCFHPRASLGVRVVCMAGHAWASWLLNPALFFKPQSPRRAKEASVSCQLRGAGDTNKRPGQWLAWGLGASGWHGALVPRWPPHLEPLPRAWGCLG